MSFHSSKTTGEGLFAKTPEAICELAGLPSGQHIVVSENVAAELLHGWGPAIVGRKVRDLSRAFPQHTFYVFLRAHSLIKSTKIKYPPNMRFCFLLKEATIPILPSFTRISSSYKMVFVLPSDNFGLEQARGSLLAVRYPFKEDHRHAVCLLTTKQASPEWMVAEVYDARRVSLVNYGMNIREKRLWPVFRYGSTQPMLYKNGVYVGDWWRNPQGYDTLPAERVKKTPLPQIF